jgi:predicted NUDIX family NTP pyrophosphohydrolase
MAKRSAGILMYRRQADAWEYLLVHPGGPFWVKKDNGAWSIPKGEYAAHEDALSVAIREFAEETGAAPRRPFYPLGQIVQAGGKVVTAWAVEDDFDPQGLKSNLFEMEWPPRSGRRQAFPEVNRAGWFTQPEAEAKILPGQRPFIKRLAELLQT